MQTLKMAGTIVFGALLSTACSDSAASLSPTAPSAMLTPPAVLAGAVSAEASGANGNGKDKNKPTTPITPTTPSTPTPPTNTSPVAPVAPANPVTGKTELEGAIASKAGTSITVNGQVVLVPSTAVIRHGSRVLALADLHVGDRVHVSANRVTAGTGLATTTQLEATEIKVQNPSRDDDDADDDEEEEEDEEDGGVTNRVEVEGIVSARAGTCPALSFSLGGKTVVTTVSTVFKDGTCAAVLNGVSVEVDGLLQANGTVLATVVDIDR